MKKWKEHMKKRGSSTQPMVHSRLVPAWGDEFDLRLYFSLIHPGQYELRNASEHRMAKQLLAAVVAFGACHVGIYRAAIRTAPGSAVLKLVVKCTRTARRLGQPAYSVWYEKPQPGFSGRSPQAWFRAQDQSELADLLRLKTRVEERDVLIEIPFQGPSEAKPPVKDELESGLGTAGEFGLQPYLARWHPSNYELGSQGNYRLALELYDAMAAEFTGWLALYQAAMTAARQVDGAMEATVRCAMKALEIGLPHYLEWFHTAQAEFGALSPKQWFLDKNLTQLCSLLQGSR